MEGINTAKVCGAILMAAAVTGLQSETLYTYLLMSVKTNAKVSNSSQSIGLSLSTFMIYLM